MRPLLFKSNNIRKCLFTSTVTQHVSSRAERISNMKYKQRRRKETELQTTEIQLEAAKILGAEHRDF